MSGSAPKVGAKVKVKDKDLIGTVAYVGLTEFAAGKWIGVILEEAKGKNNGTVQGKEYFKCQDKHGTFVRQTQLVNLDEGEEDERPISRASSVSSVASSTKEVSPKSEKPPGGGARATPTKLATPRSAIPKPGAAGGASGGSRLPMPGRGPTSARSPSYTNLKANRGQKDGGTPTAGIKKERSFVQKDFQQTVAPPSATTPAKAASPAPAAAATPKSASAMTASMVAGSPAAMTERLEEKVAALQAQQELTAAKDQIRDLEEKVETLKIKRAKDQEKMKEFEKMSIQHDQLIEFKSRIMEAQGSLQKDLQKAKHEAREAIEAKEKHAEEMSELAETVEMATLDKEMAEEKAEALQIELDATKERVEELVLDLDIIKAEVGEDGKAAEGGVTNYEIKQHVAQNEKLKETLVRMRDLLAHEKNQNQKIVKDLEEKTSSNTELSKQNEKVLKQNEELETTISDLQEQVDAALGAEEMVENLTTKCLDLEDKYAAILEEKEDLENLHDLNEELQENARELELQLREDLDLAQGKIREITRSRDAAYEIIGDHEKTIKNFREHVKKVQDQNLDLRSALEKETNKPVSTPAEMMNFKAMFEETKAHSKAIDMELRMCTERQAKQHVHYLTTYMSDSFMMRGGDNEAVLVLLLVPRMIWKSDILLSQIRESFSAPETIDTNSLFKGHDVDKFTFGCALAHHLEALMATLNEFLSALTTCAPETFLRVGTCYPEMSVHEKAVDFYIELLKKSQLDENVPLDHLEKGLQYFQSVYPLHFEGEKIDHPTFLKHQVKTVGSAVEALSPEIEIGKLLLPEGQDGTEIGTLLKTLEANNGEMKQQVKAMRRRLPTDPNLVALVSFPASTALKLGEVGRCLTPLVKTLHVFARTAAQHAGLQGETTLPPTKLSELMHQAVDKVYEFNETGLEAVRNNMESAMKSLSELNKSYQDGEWDVEKLPEKPRPPVAVRAEAYKAEIKEAESMKHKLEKKDADMKELKLGLRSKGEELSEMQVRKDKAEKKLLDATRDAELMREKLQRKVDDLQVLLKKKEKDFEVTMEHLQADIDQLEGEKGELKDKIKDITKQTLFKEINKKLSSAAPLAAAAGSGAASAGPVSLGPSLPMPVKDSPRLRQQLQEMQTALLTLKESSYKNECEEMRQKLSKLRPIVLPKMNLYAGAVNEEEKADKSKDDEDAAPDLLELMKRAQKLKAEINRAMLSPVVVDLRKRSGPDALSSLMQRKNRQTRLLEEAERLQLEVARLKASRRLGGEVESSFATFPSSQFARADAEKDFQVVGKIRLPAKEAQTVPIIVGMGELKKIHASVLAH